MMSNGGDCKETKTSVVNTGQVSGGALERRQIKQLNHMSLMFTTIASGRYYSNIVLTIKRMMMVAVVKNRIMLPNLYLFLIYQDRLVADLWLYHQ